MDELKYLDMDGINDIEIPEGLEERLSMKIDQWAESEGGQPRRAKRISLMRTISVAAGFILLIGIGMMLHGVDDKAHKDTFDNPEIACREAEKALELLAYNLGKGMEHLEKAKEMSVRTNNLINTTLEKIGNNE